MATAYDIIIRPIITERAMSGAADKKYVFEVAKDAGKIEIKKAVEEIFGVKVMKVNTINCRASGSAWASTSQAPGHQEGGRHPDPGLQGHRAF